MRRGRAELTERYPADAAAIRGHLRLLGWSPRRGEFVGYEARHDDDFAVRSMAPGVYLAPDPGHPMPPTLSLDRHIEAARMQHRMMMVQAEEERDVFPSIGGDLILCELTPAGPTLRKAARLDGYEALAAAMASAA